MSKITDEATRAFYNSNNYKKSNTIIEIDGISNKLYFYNKLIDEKFLIAELKNSEDGLTLYISNCGWKTQTTKERLNSIVGKYGLYIKQKNFEWFLVSNIESVEFNKGNSLNGVIIF